MSLRLSQVPFPFNPSVSEPRHENTYLCHMRITKSLLFAAKIHVVTLKASKNATFYIWPYPKLKPVYRVYQRKV